MDCHSHNGKIWADQIWAQVSEPVVDESAIAGIREIHHFAESMRQRIEAALKEIVKLIADSSGERYRAQ